MESRSPLISHDRVVLFGIGHASLWLNESVSEYPAHRGITVIEKDA